MKQERARSERARKARHSGKVSAGNSYCAKRKKASSFRSERVLTAGKAGLLDAACSRVGVIYFSSRSSVCLRVAELRLDRTGQDRTVKLRVSFASARRKSDKSRRALENIDWALACTQDCNTSGQIENLRAFRFAFDFNQSERRVRQRSFTAHKSRVNLNVNVNVNVNRREKNVARLHFNQLSGSFCKDGISTSRLISIEAIRDKRATLTRWRWRLYFLSSCA